MTFLEKSVRLGVAALCLGGIVNAAGCSKHPTNPEPAYGGLAVKVRPPFHPAMARLQIGDNPVLYELDADDFTTGPHELVTTGPRPLPSRGEIRMRASLVAVDDTLATAILTFELRPGCSYGVQINVGSTREDLVREYRHAQVLGVPLRYPGSMGYMPGDSMFVVHSERPPVMAPECGQTIGGAP